MLFQTLLLLSVNLVAGQLVDDQPFLFPLAGNVLQVGETVTLKWHAEDTIYPNVTIVLWDPTPDGVFYDLGTKLDEIKNTGSADWTIANFGNGEYHLGIGAGTAGALANYSDSGIFTITNGVSSSSSSSVASSTATETTSTTSLASITTPHITTPQSLSTGTGGAPAQTPTFAGVSQSSGSKLGAENNLFGAILLVVLVILGITLVVE